MNCIQYFESESPSNPKLDNIETESSNEEKIDGTEMSENLYEKLQLKTGRAKRSQFYNQDF